GVWWRMRGKRKWAEACAWGCMTVNSSQEYATFAEEAPIWPVRAAQWLERCARPPLGWGKRVACMILAALPAVALRSNRWLALGPTQTVLEWSGPLAVTAVWLVWGWRRVQPVRRAWAKGMARGLALAVLGAVVISQLLMGWIPGPMRLWQGAR